MATPAPVLIAGGGIGGLALALALARTGRQSVVLEQRQTFVAAGAGIQLGPNGVHVLQDLGVAPTLLPLVGVPRSIVVRRGKTGLVLATLPLGDWIAARHGAPYWVAHRADLAETLLTAVAAEPRVKLCPGFTVVSVRQTQQVVKAISSEGQIITGSALVGADGLWSKVRGIVSPGVLPQFAGASATRAVIAATEADTLAAPTVGLWLTAGVHVVHYPVRGGAEIAVVVIAAENWQGQEWDAEADRALLLQQIEGFHPTLTRVLSRVSQWRKWALHLLPPLPSWSAGRVTLIGDAAHPMLPYLAQGGSLALEDAIALADCLACQAGGTVAAFRDFEARRRARALRVQAASQRQGRIYHLPLSLSWMRDAALRVLPGTRLIAAYDWLYGGRDGLTASNHRARTD